MRCRPYHVGLAAMLLFGGVCAAAPFSIGVLAQDGGLGVPITYSVAKLRTGDATPVLQRPLSGPGNAVASRDRRRVLVLSARPDRTRSIEVLDAADFRVLRSIVMQPPFAWDQGGALAEWPEHPDVLMLSRCWWIDTRTGEMLETPESLGISCPSGDSDDGLSASGRYLLLPSFDTGTSSWRRVLVETAHPRVHVQTLPMHAGPILDDDSAVAVGGDNRIELWSTQGNGTVETVPAPPQARHLWPIGAYQGSLYATAFDTASSRQAIFRYRRDSAQWSVVVVPFDHELLLHADFHGHWASFTAPSIDICAVGCWFTESSRVLLDTDSGAVIRTVWPAGGLVSQGRNLLASHPAVPVDAFTGLFAPLLLIVWMVLAARTHGVWADGCNWCRQPRPLE